MKKQSSKKNYHRRKKVRKLKTIRLVKQIQCALRKGFERIGEPVAKSKGLI